MYDLNISFARLENVSEQLNDICSELENATDLSEELEGAIGRPYGRDELRDRARDFEERWDDKRKQLKESLESIEEHVSEVLKAFKDWDQDTAVHLSSANEG